MIDFNTLIIVITHACNLQCRPCPVFQSSEYIHEDILKKSIRLFLKPSLQNGKKIIRFFGGEPLLFFSSIKQGIKLAQSTAKKNNIELHFAISTNATLLDTPKLEYLKSYSNLELAINSYTFHLVNRSLIDSLLSSPALTINMLIHPGKVSRFFEEFKQFLNMGFRRLNFLPAYYTDWTSGQSSILEKELKKISKFLCSGNKLEKIHIKNLYVKGEVALYNSCLVVDCNGDIYPNNLILSGPFLNLKPLLRLGNVFELDNLSEIKEVDIDIDGCIRKFASSSKLSSTHKVDKILDSFLDSLRHPRRRIIRK